VVAATTFWVAVGLLGYTYVGYGGLVWLMARVRPRKVAAAPIRPFVTAVVVGYNEASRIAARIENLLEQDYPADRLEIVIASDGSTDAMVEIARRYEPRIRVASFPDRRGKPAVLNDVIPMAKGEIVVLGDSRQRFDRRVVTTLVENLADPTVGAVSGELVFLKEGQTEAAVEGAAFYWDYEKLIRWSESQVDSTVGVTGAVYALRRDLFEVIPAATVLDDVVIPMRIARRGFRVLFEPRARAFDWKAPTSSAEFSRKVRTLAGNFQMFATERWMLSPFANRLWVQTVSHKWLRLVLPVFYVAALGANLFLLDRAFYQLTMAAQAAFFGVALAGYLFPGIRRATPLVIVPYAICFLSWATVVGFFRFVTGRQQVTWDQRSTATR